MVLLFAVIQRGLTKSLSGDRRQKKKKLSMSNHIKAPETDTLRYETNGPAPAWCLSAVHHWIGIEMHSV